MIDVKLHLRDRSGIVMAKRSSLVQLVDFTRTHGPAFARMMFGAAAYEVTPADVNTIALNAALTWNGPPSDPIADIERSMHCMSYGRPPEPFELSCIFLFCDLVALLGRPRSIAVARLAWARAISQPAEPNGVYFRRALQDARENARARWLAFFDAFR